MASPDGTGVWEANAMGLDNYLMLKPTERGVWQAINIP